MTEVYFENIFKVLPTPVVVCRNEEGYPLVFVNNSAKFLINPLQPIESLTGKGEAVRLRELVRLQNEEDYGNILHAMVATGSVQNYKTSLYNFEEGLLPVVVSGNLAELGGKEYYIFYLSEYSGEDSLSMADANNVLSMVFNAAYHSDTVNTAIDRILSLTGSYVNVSRAYIFEEVSEILTRNTYEWCAEGVEPAIQDLQELKKEDYNYDVIVNGGMYITDDIRELPEQDRQILEAQGIKSLAIIPLFQLDKPLGYIGFDDCTRYRKWNSNEINLLKSVASIIVTLIARRNAEQQAARSFEIMQTISNNMDSIIYVNTLDTYELVFINKALSDTLNRPVEEIMGKACWQVLQKDKSGPCEFCPIPKLMDKDGRKVTGGYSWEFQNTIKNKWYLVRDSIIKWIDGRDVHIETATEITPQKQYEEQLKYYASTDTMTDTFNREWGYKIIQEMMHPFRRRGQVSLCFLDLDGLKIVNDTYGHDAGDEMIKQTVGVIRSSIRKEDIICRWGGDEFILLLGCQPDMAFKIMANIQDALARVNETRKNPFDLSFSFGITELSVAHSIDELISKADRLMYENKLSKRHEKDPIAAKQQNL